VLNSYAASYRNGGMISAPLDSDRCDLFEAGHSRRVMPIQSGAIEISSGVRQMKGRSHRRFEADRIGGVQEVERRQAQCEAPPQTLESVQV
jgi:hypothetical protein